MGGAVSAPLKVVSSLLGGDVPEPTPPPAPPPVTEAPLPPDQDDQATRKAQKRRTAEIQARGGRLSTILTEQGGDKLGA